MRLEPLDSAGWSFVKRHWCGLRSKLEIRQLLITSKDNKFGKFISLDRNDRLDTGR